MTSKELLELGGGVASSPAAGMGLYVVDVSGNSRFVTIEDLKTFVNTNPTVVPSSEPWKGSRVYRTTDLALTTSTSTPVPWEAEESISAAGVWSAGAPTRLTTLTGWTLVRLRAGIRFASNATGLRGSHFLKNGSSGFRGNGLFWYPTGGTLDHAFTVTSGVISVVGGTDYFEVIVNQSSGGDLNLEGDQVWVWFEIECVERTV